jgi:hypothetical protein
MIERPDPPELPWQRNEIKDQIAEKEQYIRELQQERKAAVANSEYEKESGSPTTDIAEIDRRIQDEERSLEELRKKKEADIGGPVTPPDSQGA